MNVYSENRNSYTIIYGAGSQQLPEGLRSSRLTDRERRPAVLLLGDRRQGEERRRLLREPPEGTQRWADGDRMDG